MYLFFSLIIFIVQFALPYFVPTQNYNLGDDITWHGVLALSDTSSYTNSDVEELVYNWKVYFDEEDQLVDKSLEKLESSVENNINASISDITIKNTDDIPLLDDKVVESSYIVFTWEILDEEEEIVFYDDFDTWYREELEEIWE